ncbi:MAG: translation initiation factor IF-2 [Bacteroidaceae bacterium]|nr:translation initiation factor IF-2 [Bacteroidaceae bacterium]
MGVRINKVLKEFNIGLQTVIDFLAKKGFTVKNDMNAKLTDEQYQIIKNEFCSDKNLRNKADILISQRHTEKDKKSFQPKKSAEEIKTEIPEDSKLQIKPVGKIDLSRVGKPATAPTPAPILQPTKEPQAAPEEATEPAKEEKKEGDKQATAPVAEKQDNAVETKVEVTDEVPAATVQQQEKPLPEIEKEAPIKEEPTTEKPQSAAEAPAKVYEAPTATKEEKPKKETAETTPTVTEQPASKETNETKTAEEDSKSDGIFRLNPTTTITGPKVLGTIDLSSINENTRPRKKSKEEKKKEREEKLRQQHNNAGNTANNNGQPGAGGQSKKKRKRISGNKVDINAEAKKSEQARQDNNNRNNQKNKNKKQQQPSVLKPQVSDEDVAKEVKKTLARLTSKKNFSNSAKYRREKRDQVRAANEERMNEENAESKILKLTEFVTANELASMMDVPVTKVISTCMSIGMMISINQRMDAETINLVADEFGFQTEYVSASVSEAVHEEEDNEEDLEPRDPIVTIMGHVDHGKTSLLDYIRNSNVIAGEAGGITQHIGAYNVTLENGRHITFLDTPGHEAFTAMRARGAQVTDIAIIIIAADDDVMPQTKEAINHAMAANVPIVFAINKVDKPTANPEKIKETLANMNFLVEDWGGKYQSQDISAKKGIGVNELLEKVLLEADMLELKANPNRNATGTIIESSLDKGRGYVATILVSNGTLHIGDNVIAGTCYGRVKDLSDERGKHVDHVGPARAATLLGFNGAPQAGDTFHVMNSEQEMRDIANKRLQLQREQSLRTNKRPTLEDIGNRIAIGGFQELNLIVKGDVDGSVEALSDALIKLSTKKIAVNVIHKAVGQITESDVSLAAASQAIIIGFQVRPSAQARKEADQEGIDVRLYSIIYDAIHDVKTAMEGMLKPIIKEEQTGTLEVRQVYHISKVGTVAGAFVIDGKVHRSDKARLIRDGIVKFTGEINALKRFKDDVKEVTTNFECGISLTNCNDILEGDLIETFHEIEIKQKL